MPPMGSPHSIRLWATPLLCRTLAFDAVRIAIDDRFLWSRCDPHVADGLGLEGRRKLTLPEAAQADAYTSKVE